MHPQHLERTHYQSILQISTRPASFHRITAQVAEVVRESQIQLGLCHLFCRHTSASLVIQENADPDVLEDLATFLQKLVPADPHRYRHTTEGPDDMPAHIRTALTHTSEIIPIQQGRLMLGTWQGIYLWEHRSHAHTREVVVHVTGAA